MPGLSPDTAATTLSPQQDPKACQSYKPAFREAEDNNQQERRDGGHGEMAIKCEKRGGGRRK